MGWYVHIHVCFSCHENEGVAKLAGRHLDHLIQNEDQITNDLLKSDINGSWINEAKWFLDDLSKRSGRNPGPKGGLSLWGMTSNNVNVYEFCGFLRPFWHELLSEVKGGPGNTDRVVVFEEEEQSEAANAYQIGWDYPWETSRILLIKEFRRLPFSWQNWS